MFCTNCGAQINDDSLFCENCGAKIRRTDAGNTGSAKSTGNSQNTASSDAIPGQGTPYTQNTAYGQPDHNQNDSYGQFGSDYNRDTSYGQSGYGYNQNTSYGQPGYGYNQNTSYGQSGYGYNQNTSYGQPGYGYNQNASYGQSGAMPDSSKKKNLALIIGIPAAVIVLGLLVFFGIRFFSSRKNTPSLEKILATEEMQEAAAQINAVLEEAGIQVELLADGDTLVYAYHLSDDFYGDLSENDKSLLFASITKSQLKMVSTLFEQFREEYDYPLKSVRFVFYGADGSKIFEQEITEEEAKNGTFSFPTEYPSSDMSEEVPAEETPADTAPEQAPEPEENIPEALPTETSLIGTWVLPFDYSAIVVNNYEREGGKNADLSDLRGTFFAEVVLVFQDNGDAAYYLNYDEDKKKEFFDTVLERGNLAIDKGRPNEAILSYRVVDGNKIEYSTDYDFARIVGTMVFSMPAPDELIIEDWGDLLVYTLYVKDIIEYDGGIDGNTSRLYPMDQIDLNTGRPKVGG